MQQHKPGVYEVGDDTDGDVGTPPLQIPAGRRSEPANVVLVAGNSHRKLAERIAAKLAAAGVLPTGSIHCQVGKFADGEINVAIDVNVRGRDVYIIQPTCGSQAGTGGGSVNDHLMELLLLAHTLRLASAASVTAVVPYFGYARQDRKVKARTPISASAVAQLIEAMHVDRVLTVDLHCGQIQGFFHGTPVDNLYAENLMAAWVKRQAFDPLVIVSPDAGGVARARRVADIVCCSSVATIIKRRMCANEVASAELVGAVAGAHCVIVDDMVDTAGTLCKAAELLVANGAASVHACATHGLFSGPAVARIQGCAALTNVVVTNSIPQVLERWPAEASKLTVLDLTDLLASAIHRLHARESLSELFRAD